MDDIKRQIQELEKENIRLSLEVAERYLEGMHGKAKVYRIIEDHKHRVDVEVLCKHFGIKEGQFYEWYVKRELKQENISTLIEEKWLLENKNISPKRLQTWLLEDEGIKITQVKIKEYLNEIKNK